MRLAFLAVVTWKKPAAVVMVVVYQSYTGLNWNRLPCLCLIFLLLNAFFLNAPFSMTVPPLSPRGTSGPGHHWLCPINNLEGYNVGIKVISIDLTFLSSPTKPKRQMLFEKWKTTDSAIMTMDFQQIICQTSASVDELVELYNSSLSSVFDVHAPVKMCEDNCSCSAACFTHDLQNLKTAGHVLEWHTDPLGSLSINWPCVNMEIAYSKCLKNVLSQLYSNLINNSPGNPKHIFPPSVI